MERLVRYQHNVPILLLGLGIGLTFLIGVSLNSGTPYSFFLPGVIVLVTPALFLLVNEHARIGAIFLLFVISLGGEGIGAEEVLLAIYSVLFLGIWFFERIIAQKTIIENSADLALAIFIGMVFIGAGIGLINQPVPNILAGELFNFCLLLFYFPFREYCRKHKKGSINILYMIIICGVYISISNIFSFTELISRSPDARGIAGGRVASSEILLYTATMSSMILLSLKNTTPRNLALGAALTLCLIATILTQFRSIYIGILIATLVVFFYASQLSRRKLFMIFFFGTIIAASGIYILLGDAAMLLAGGIMDRILSIGSASEQDISFINRFFEYEKAVELIIQSPIIGHGLGVNFTFYDAIFRFSWSKAFVHNVPLHLLYKLGLIGFLSLSYVLLRHTIDSWVSIRRSAHPHNSGRLFASLKIATILGLLVIGLFSTLFNSDTTLIYAALLATHPPRAATLKEPLSDQ